MIEFPMRRYVCMSYDLAVLKSMLEDAISELYRDNWFFFVHGVGEWSISS